MAQARFVLEVLHDPSEGWGVRLAGNRSPTPSRADRAETVAMARRFAHVLNAGVGRTMIRVYDSDGALVEEIEE